MAAPAPIACDISLHVLGIVGCLERALRISILLYVYTPLRVGQGGGGADEDCSVYQPKRRYGQNYASVALSYCCGEQVGYHRSGPASIGIGLARPASSRESSSRLDPAIASFSGAEDGGGGWGITSHHRHRAAF